MILSDADILARLEEGDLVIDPLDDVDLQVQPASVDVRLGREFLEFQRANIPCIHPNSENEVSEYVEETVVEEGDEFILHPGDFVLGTTHERVEVPSDLVAQVEGRSSLGRLAIVVHASLPADEQLFLWTPEGGFGFYEIGDVVESEQNARAVSFDPETLTVRTFEISDFITNPVKRIYRLELDSGRSVHVTKDHNVFTLDKHGRVTRVASEDAEGQRVMVPKKLPGPRGAEARVDIIDLLDDDREDIVVRAADGLGDVDWSDAHATTQKHYESADSAPMGRVKPGTIPADADISFKQSDQTLPREIPIGPDFGWVLGFYIAEGYSRRKQVVFTNNDDQLLERIASYFKMYDTSLSWHRKTNGASQLTVCSALWSRIFRALAGAGREKNIPKRAWNWSDEVLKALYDGLLEGDGHRRAGRDTLYTANPELANRAQYLGSRLGLITSAYDRDRSDEPNGPAEERVEWSVDFYEEAHKRGAYFPNPSKLLRDYRTRAGLTMQEVADEIGRSSKGSISNVENREYDSVKRDTLEDLRSCYQNHGVDTTRLNTILDSDVRFDKVDSVVDTGRVETTYDLEVQPAGRQIENFLGGFGGIFLSNTAGFIDPGFRGHITLELSNLGSAPVALNPGMRISQLVFTELKTPADRPYGSARGSKYQDQAGPEASRIRGDREFGGDQ